MIFVEKIEIVKKLIRQKDVSFGFLLLSTFLLPLSINLSTFTFILSLASKMMQIIFYNNKIFATKALKHSSIIGIIFFCYIVLSSIFQTDLNYTFFVFEKQFSHWTLLFLAPMLLGGTGANKLLMYSFALGTMLTVLYVLIMCFYFDVPFNKQAFSRFVDIHHTYLALFLLFLINILLIEIIRIRDKTNFINLILLALPITISLLVIFNLESKASIVIAMLLFIIHFFPQFFKSSILKSTLLVVCIVCILFFFNQKISVSYERALDFRLQIWDAAIENIESQPVFGNLKDSEKDLLNYRHFINGKYYYMDSDLNSHNQYLSIILKYGFLGLILLSFFMINIYRKTNKQTEVKTIREFIGFTCIILLTFYIENVLDRHHGMMFFSVFYNYYLIKVENAKDD